MHVDNESLDRVDDLMRGGEGLWVHFLKLNLPLSTMPLCVTEVVNH